MRYSLRTILLMFVLLAAALGTAGIGGIPPALFVLAISLAAPLCVRREMSCLPLALVGIYFVIACCMYFLLMYLVLWPLGDPALGTLLEGGRGYWGRRLAAVLFVVATCLLLVSAVFDNVDQ